MQSLSYTFTAPDSLPFSLLVYLSLQVILSSINCDPSGQTGPMLVLHSTWFVLGAT